MSRNRSLVAFEKRMQRLPQAVRKAVQPAVLQGAEELAARMRSLAPDDPATGEPDLRTSIAVTGPGQRTPAYSQPGGSMTVDELSAVVTVGGIDVRYPHLLEYGTVDTKAQPFFWPSVRLLKKRVQGRIKRAVGKAAREAWGK